jgi:3-methyladenine DNA glycosylase/8-oxoguanine DNA glycosylase
MLLDSNVCYRADLMLLRAAKVSAKQLHARAEAWRPWRAYATHYLWQPLGAIP